MSSKTHSCTDYDQGAPNSGVNPATGVPYRLVTVSEANPADITTDVTKVVPPPAAASILARGARAVNMAPKARYGARLARRAGHNRITIRALADARISTSPESRTSKAVGRYIRTPHKSYQRLNPRNSSGGYDKDGPVSPMSWRDLNTVRRHLR